MYKLICQKPGRFLSVQIVVISSFPQMFVELGTYNFSQLMKNVPFQHFFFLNWSIKVLRFQIPGECLHQKENYFLLLNMNDFMWQIFTETGKSGGDKNPKSIFYLFQSSN